MSYSAEDHAARIAKEDDDRRRLNDHYLTDVRRQALDRAVDDIVAAGSSQAWLSRRWTELNRDAPPFLTSVATTRPYSSTVTREVTRREVEVDPSHIVDFTNDGPREWGVLDNRPESLADIARRLVDARATDSYGEWLSWRAGMGLFGIEGPVGPLYQVTNGRHGAHVLRAVAPPSLIIDTVHFSRAWLAGDRAQKTCTPEFLDASEYQRLVGLEADGVIADLARHRGRRVRPRPGRHTPPDTDDVTFTVCVDLPIAWAIEEPTVVASMTEDYCRVYPHFVDDPCGQALLDPLKGQQWLRSLRRL